MLMWAEVYEVGRDGVVHALSGRNINSFCVVLQCFIVLLLFVHMLFFPFFSSGKEVGPVMQSFMYAHFVRAG